MDRLPRKTMASSNKKVYSLTSEIKSVLERKHDKWSVVMAFDRVKFDLNVLNALCKVLMCLFRKEEDNDGSEVACVCNIV